MDRTKASKFTVGMVGIAAIGLLVMTQGCSSSNNDGTGGKGGASATGGKGGAAGGTSLGGATGNDGGGTGGAGVALCTGVALTGAPAITDFSDALLAEAGTADPTIPGKGGLYHYGGTTVTVTGGSMHVTGTVAAGVYAGAGVYFNDCIDATAYTGVSFVLTGNLGTCDMSKLAATFPQVQLAPVAPATGKGVCGPPTATNCYGPGAPFTPPTTTAVTFASMVNGGAVATITADAQSRIDGIDFGFHGPAATDASAGGCTVDFTIDDLKFTP